MSKPEAAIIARNTGAFIEIGGDYKLWKSDKDFNALIKKIKEMRDTVLHNGEVLGAI